MLKLIKYKSLYLSVYKYQDPNSSVEDSIFNQFTFILGMFSIFLFV